MKIESLWIYPIKSCQGISLSQLSIDEQGPRYDRQWMLVDERGRFISQRELPQLAQVKTEIDDHKNILHVALPRGNFEIPLPALSGSSSESDEIPAQVQIWQTELLADIEHPEINLAFSNFLERSVRLVRYTDQSHRSLNSLNPNFAPETRFADSRPLLLTHQSSLQQLNKELQSTSSEPIEINRFRPNVVVQGGKAYEEDQLERWQAGDVVFSQRKPCSRCVMINIDQKTGENRGPEPLKTLSQTRKQEGKVIFGSLYIPENKGEIKVGDEIVIL